MKKILVIMIAMLVVITGCALNEEKYNKELESNLNELIKIGEEFPENPALEEFSKRYEESSTILENTSKLELNDVDLTDINAYIMLYSKMDMEFAKMLDKHSKNSDGKGIEDLDEKVFEDMADDYNEIYDEYSDKLNDPKEKANDSLEKLYEDKKISEATYNLIKDMLSELLI